MSGGIELRGLRLARGAHPVLAGVDLRVEPGEVCALMGASGAGKSTALRVVAALEPFDAGEVRVGEVTLRPGPLPRPGELRSLRRAVGMVFQHHALWEHLSVLDNVALAPAHALGWPRERAVREARALLDELGIGARAEALPARLSGGEAQRAAIARALVVRPAMLLLDEPTSALDPARRDSLGALLRAVAERGVGLLVATHDLDFARRHADRVALLRDGRIEDGAAG